MKIFVSNKTIFKPSLQLLIANQNRCCGNQLVPVDNWDEADFIWKNLVRGLELDKLPALQILNIFMTSHQTLTEKHALQDTGNHCIQGWTDIAPETHLSTAALPTDHGLWISKPVDNYGGNGIRIHRGPIRRHHITQGLSVVQRYIERPMLYHGHKMDIRMFVLLGLDEVRYYRDGFARISTDPYEEPNLDLGQTMSAGSIRTVHLTNGTQGNKVLGLDMVLDEVGINKEMLFDFIKSLKPLFQHAQQTETKYRRDNHILFESFELLGLDIMIDADRKPWLLEINKDPSIVRNGQLDGLIDRLLEDTLKEAVWFKLEPGLKTATGWNLF